MRFKPQSLRKDTRAVSPAISTVMITGVLVALVMTTVVFANNFLDARIAENEYSSSKQFMLTTGLQVDDVAWTMGRAQTIRYSSRYGYVTLEPSVLSYSFEVSHDGSTWDLVLTNTTGIILYNMPTSIITYGNNYFERIFPSNSSFLLGGSAAPVTHVFAVEKLPMADGSYTRVVVAPSIRNLTSTVGETSYVKFFLPSLSTESNLYRSQSITLTGSGVSKLTKSAVDKVRVNVTFPSAAQGYDSTFFNFERTSEIVDFADNSVVEFYVGKVIVSLGLHT
jgi:hypothetical protein